ncbi:hypothetical protein GLOIN_2v1642866 [Rhizophagus clarus]|uniref:Uncharacterized protein n=1 Tax=Rhizophagus clarus TaxID=94130 RepID=A0A8H3QC94_9GLOM|nr:hypothetical protein GLOIN_2v1642866 [Rhizophagus clarus]
MQLLYEPANDEYTVSKIWIFLPFLAFELDPRNINDLKSEGILHGTMKYAISEIDDFDKIIKCFIEKDEKRVDRIVHAEHCEYYFEWASPYVFDGMHKRLETKSWDDYLYKIRTMRILMQQAPIFVRVLRYSPISRWMPEIRNKKAERYRVCPTTSQELSKLKTHLIFQSTLKRYSHRARQPNFWCGRPIC